MIEENGVVGMTDGDLDYRRGKAERSGLESSLADRGCFGDVLY